MASPQSQAKKQAEREQKILEALATIADEVAMMRGAVQTLINHLIEEETEDES